MGHGHHEGGIMVWDMGIMKEASWCGTWAGSCKLPDPSTTGGGASYLTDPEVHSLGLFCDLARGLGKGIRWIGNGDGPSHKFSRPGIPIFIFCKCE